MFLNGYYTENLIMKGKIFYNVVGWKNYKIVGQSLMLDLVELEYEYIGMRYNKIYSKWSWVKLSKIENDFTKSLKAIYSY